MREIQFNGYIDDEVWFGDEVTPDSLREALYGESGGEPDDVHITLQSFGGSCNAATQMYDMLSDYPGRVNITVSGTAASAATVVCMAADTLEMSPGSIFMVHDPSSFACGNERDMQDCINLLRACKESILNVYATRCTLDRDDIARLMTATTWMDAEAALTNGFVDGIAKTSKPTNTTMPRVVNRREAEAKVAAFYERHKPQHPKNAQPHPAPEQQCPGVPYAQLHRRLELIKH